MTINKKEQMISELEAIDEDVASEIEKRLYTKENIHGFAIEYDAGYECSSLQVIVKTSACSVYRIFDISIYKNLGRLDVDEICIGKEVIHALITMQGEQTQKYGRESL